MKLLSLLITSIFGVNAFSPSIPSFQRATVGLAIASSSLEIENQLRDELLRLQTEFQALQELKNDLYQQALFFLIQEYYEDAGESVMELVEVENMILEKGFTMEQFELTLVEYTELGFMAQDEDSLTLL